MAAPKPGELVSYLTLRRVVGLLGVLFTIAWFLYTYRGFDRPPP
jgi:hypothetical protein